MHVTFTFQLGFVSFVCFPLFFSLSLLLLTEPAVEEPEKNPALSPVWFLQIHCQVLPGSGGLCGWFFDGFFFFFLNGTWPPVTRRAYTGSWLVKALSLLSLFPQQLLCTDSLEDREEQMQVRRRDGHQGHSRDVFSLDTWSHYSPSPNCKMA